MKKLKWKKDKEKKATWTAKAGVLVFTVKPPYRDVGGMMASGNTINAAN